MEGGGDEEVGEAQMRGRESEGKTEGRDRKWKRVRERGGDR